MLYVPYPNTASSSVSANNNTNIRFYDASVVNGINLREEFDRLLIGEGSTPGIGRYVLYRHFDTTQPSQFYNEETKEAVGGPAYFYTDQVVLTFSVEYTVGRQMRMSNLELPYGGVDVPFILFFFRYDVPITSNDEIYELPYNNGLPPDMSQVQLPLTDRFRILLPEPHRCDNHGRIEYWGASVIREIAKH